MSREKEYAYYKNDSFIAIGTKKELAKETGVAVGTIEHYITPSYRNRVSNGIRVIPLEEETV